MGNGRGKYNNPKWIGKRFGRLTIIEPVHVVKKNGSKQWFWKVKCNCGTEKVVLPNDLISGHSASCGCLRREGARLPTYHKESHTHLHNIWCGMNSRCNPDHKYSERYGKRGITVCDEWSDYTKFAEWARANGYEDGLTIERIDVDGNYCPENCTWIPLAKQARNRSTTHWVEYQGEKMSLAEAAERAGLPYKQVHYRIKRRGWPVEKALSTPIKGPSELKRKCEEAGMNYNRVYNRIHVYGWTEEDALNIPIAGKGANQTTYNRQR